PEAGVLHEPGANALRELGMRVQAGADRGAAERDLAQPLERRLDARLSLADLGRVAAELLAQRDRDGVHPVRAARLDDVRKLVRLALQGRSEPVERGQQVVCDLVQRGEVHGRREHVVRALAHVHVVVHVDAIAGDGRDHLVRVHVRGGAGARLEDVDRELRVELAVRDPVAGGRDPLRLLGVEQAQLTVHARGGSLDPSQPAGDGRGDRLPGDREVADRLPRLSAPELTLGCRRIGGHATEVSSEELARDAYSAISQLSFAKAAPQALVEVLHEGPAHVRTTRAFVLRLVPALAAVEALDHAETVHAGRVDGYPLTG